MRARVAGLMLALAAGCIPQAAELRPAVLWERVTGESEGGFILRTALAERPAGDETLTRTIWAAAARPLPHELSTLLGHNGIRVGVIPGPVPAAFEAILTAEAGLIAATDRTFRAGKGRVIPVAGPLDRTEAAILTDLAADPDLRRFPDAECGLSVTPEAAPAGQVKLACLLQIQHGEAQLYLKPTADNAGFTRQERKALTPFPALAFTVTLAPTDTLIIGATESPAGTLGSAFFTDINPARVRQRVLVVRASTAAPAPAAPTGSLAR